MITNIFKKIKINNNDIFLVFVLLLILVLLIIIFFKIKKNKNTEKYKEHLTENDNMITFIIMILRSIIIKQIKIGKQL